MTRFAEELYTPAKFRNMTEDQYDDYLLWLSANTCGVCGAIDADLNRVESGEQLLACDTCYAEIEAAAEGAAAPAECQHVHVTIARYDVGRCEQTGYYDAGETMICRDCGYEEVA